MLKRLIGGFALGFLLTAGTVCAEVIVKVAPPAEVAEARPASPGPNYIWIGGYQRWDGAAYVWVPGRWEVPPHPGARWVAHRWVRRHDGYAFVEGRWR
ncbi:MAG: YXWGXW repeat-containing protein [Bryobacteraceae bacterium]|jgi:hypothetical protein